LYPRPPTATPTQTAMSHHSPSNDAIRDPAGDRASRALHARSTLRSASSIKPIRRAGQMKRTAPTMIRAHATGLAARSARKKATAVGVIPPT
jgi:hypothetical protein